MATAMRTPAVALNDAIVRISSAGERDDADDRRFWCGFVGWRGIL